MPAFEIVFRPRRGAIRVFQRIDHDVVAHHWGADTAFAPDVRTLLAVKLPRFAIATVPMMIRGVGFRPMRVVFFDGRLAALKNIRDRRLRGLHVRLHRSSRRAKRRVVLLDNDFRMAVDHAVVGIFKKKSRRSFPRRGVSQKLRFRFERVQDLIVAPNPHRAPAIQIVFDELT